MQSQMQHSSEASAKPVRRVAIACRNCRKRKIKCEAQENPPLNPCQRCIRNNLQCEYITIAHDPDVSSPAAEPPQPQQSGGQAPLYLPLYNNALHRGSNVLQGPSSRPYNPLESGYAPHPSGHTNFPPANFMLNSDQSMQYPIYPSTNHRQFQSHSANNSLQQANTGHNYWMNDPASPSSQYAPVPEKSTQNSASQWPQLYQQGSVPFEQRPHPRGCICSYCVIGRV